MFNIILKRVHFFKYGFGLCLYLGIPAMGMEINTPPAKGSQSDIHQKMLSNCLPALLETYHGGDWQQVNTLATSSWRDPGNILRVAIDTQVNKLYPVLLRTFLNNEDAAKKFMAEYFFNVQCENLYDHYSANKNKTYSYFRSFPTEYLVTLAYEDKALEMGISLKTVYHQLYLIESERAKMIEARNEDISKPKEGQALQNLRNRKAPTFTIKAPRKPYRTTDAPKVKIQPPMTSPMLNDVLEDIRRGAFKLRPIENACLNDWGRARRDPNNLAAILKTRFDILHGINREVMVNKTGDQIENISKQEDEW